MRQRRDKTGDRSPKIQMTGALMAGESGMKVAVRRGKFKFVENTDDIGGGRTGKPTSKSLIREQARCLAAGYTSKKELANELSRWLSWHHPDEPEMTPEVVERHITDIWQAHHPR
jgi:hypothetical protein